MTLFRVRGVPVRVGWSWLLVLGLIGWSLAAGVFPSSYPRLPAATHITMAVIAALLFFASILLHELSHTLRSLREGVPVRDVTLWLFGGVSTAEEPLPGPAAEFRVVVAGPVASAVLAGFFWILATVGSAIGLGNAWVGVPSWLAWINALLLGFNLVPALPLDGGRLLHALLWWRSGDSATATIQAAVAGRTFAGVLIALGVVAILYGPGIGGIWFLLIGWFLLQAVAAEVGSARITRALAGLRVSDLMTTRLQSVPPQMRLDEFADLVLQRTSHPLYPVMDDGRLVGALPMRRAGAVAPGDRGATRVQDVMLVGDEVVTLPPDQPVADAMPVLSREPGRALVVPAGDPHQVMGLLSVSDLTHALQSGRPPRSSTRDRGLPRRRGWWIAVAAAVAVVAVTAAVYHPPVVVISPGRSFDVAGDITVSGRPVDRLSGDYLLTSVSLAQPTVLGLALAAVRTDRELVPLGQVAPTGIPPGTIARFERTQFVESQQNAAVAAARQAGYDASLTGNGARVLGVVPSSPAADRLRRGDVITQVGATAIGTANELRGALEGRPVGQAVRLSVRRGSDTFETDVDVAQLSAVTGGTGIGVVAGTVNLRAQLPFDVEFRSRPGVGGPSAGLVYALALSDLLDRGDDANGRSVAATGTISPDGLVGAVGGVHEKAIAARDAGATVFLLPEGEVGAVDAAGSALRVSGVDSLDRALQRLRSP